ncbi:hypothetical protein FSP39_014846 [Pinctada imbricata]|uniref:Zinc finger PHD-type domain-containing protein n=1 Tax=Pinctada imbricata TaxID=66713 RepID=A0AA88YSM8_PINIB|nr:hypothetical protein FSP39_014846 [Pinctada imbricata]
MGNLDGSNPKSSPGIPGSNDETNLKCSVINDEIHDETSEKQNKSPETNIENNSQNKRNRTNSTGELQDPLTTPVAWSDGEDSLLCPVCDKQARDGTIECSLCERWVHFMCENMSVGDQTIYESSASEIYICSCCFIEQLFTEEQLKTQNTTNIQNGLDKSIQREESKLSREKKKQNKPPQKRLSAQEKDEYEEKLIEMRTEIIRLEKMITEQKNIIRNLKIKVGAQIPGHDSLEHETSCDNRLQRLEGDIIRMRLDILEMQMKNILGSQLPRAQLTSPENNENNLQTAQHFYALAEPRHKLR